VVVPFGGGLPLRVESASSGFNAALRPVSMPPVEVASR